MLGSVLLSSEGSHLYNPNNTHLLRPSSNKSNMEAIFQRATKSLDDVSDKHIPDYVWKKCKGVAIINVTEVGFVFSVSEGDGVIMKHNDDGTWGAPSALIYTGASGGAVFGKGHRQILLFPMTDHGVKMLTANVKYQLGAQAGLAIGPIGREVSAAADAGGEGVGATLTYEYVDGALLSAGINNNFIENSADVNFDFYKKQATGTEIVMEAGKVDIPEGKGVEEMHAKLAELAK